MLIDFYLYPSRKVPFLKIVFSFSSIQTIIKLDYINSASCACYNRLGNERHLLFLSRQLYTRQLKRSPHIYIHIYVNTQNMCIICMFTYTYICNAVGISKNISFQTSVLGKI